jgi:YggT family protein
MSQLVCVLLQFYLYAVFIRIIMSWFPLQPGGLGQQIAALLITITEPVLGPLRRVIPAVPIGAMRLDLSPIVAIFGVQILQSMIC